MSLLIRAGSDSRLVNRYGENALHALDRQKSRSQSEQTALVFYLVAVGTDVNKRNNWGATPLATAAQYSLPFVAAALLDCGADINSRDDEGDFAIHCALYFNNEEVIRLLLSRGANYTTWISTGNSIFHQAAISGNLNTIDILLAARLRDVDPDAKNRQGYTTLELAQQRERKPDGFVHRLRLLLVDVRSRNARIALGLDDDDANDLSADSIANIPLRNPPKPVRAQAQGY